MTHPPSQVPELTICTALSTISIESAYGPVAVTVFKTVGRSDELRRWVRLPRALESVRETSDLYRRILLLNRVR